MKRVTESVATMLVVACLLVNLCSAKTKTPPVVSAVPSSVSTESATLPLDGKFSDDELDDLLSPIALYPDPLLAQMVPAATFIDQLEEANRVNNDGIQEFAQKFISSPGKKDGLYWPTSTSEEESPLGPLAELARGEGYSATRDAAGTIRNEPFHGYYVKMLKSQGRNASGGRFNYVINGHMIAGFAMVAFPAVYGSSGVMTFIINQQGKVYQNDLGPNTLQIVKAMTVFDPGPGWTVVNYQEAWDTFDK